MCGGGRPGNHGAVVAGHRGEREAIVENMGPSGKAVVVRGRVDYKPIQVNGENSSTSFFRCFPLKITKITLAFGVIFIKNLSKTLPTMLLM